MPEPRLPEPQPTPPPFDYIDLGKTKPEKPVELLTEINELWILSQTDPREAFDRLVEARGIDSTIRLSLTEEIFKNKSGLAREVVKLDFSQTEIFVLALRLAHSSTESFLEMVSNCPVDLLLDEKVAIAEALVKKSPKDLLWIIETLHLPEQPIIEIIRQYPASDQIDFLRILEFQAMKVNVPIPHRNIVLTQKLLIKPTTSVVEY